MAQRLALLLEQTASDNKETCYEVLLEDLANAEAAILNTQPSQDNQGNQLKAGDLCQLKVPPISCGHEQLGIEQDITSV